MGVRFPLESPDELRPAILMNMDCAGLGPEEIDAAAKKIWDYMRFGHSLEPAAAIIALGCRRVCR